jgi:hypothetical protein
MSSAGRAANLSGCVARPKAREIGLIGFAAQIRRSSPTGSYVMETAEHREPCDSRGSCTVWERAEVKFLRATRHSRLGGTSSPAMSALLQSLPKR